MNSLALAVAHDEPPIGLEEAFHVDDAVVQMRLTEIDAQPGFNPRKFFDPVEYQKVVTSVRRHRRIFHNIVVRPQPNRPGRHWLVAGEKRWRAANEVGLAFIPTLVLDLSDDEALAIAVAENKDRDGISPGEEALAAQRMMYLTKGDREESARQLGLTPRTLDARLLLCHATEAVLTALAERKIKLGHAELLSPLPEDTQNGTLAELIARKPSVEELRAKLDVFALDLGTAKFDLTECQACPHNTTRQASLFEQNIGQGRCTNRPCFHHKTVEHLASLRTTLREEHNAVYLDTERPNNLWALLLKRDVGVQQFNEGCKQCANFGCLISTMPGSAGTLTTDVCFDLACRSGKIEDYQATLKSSESDEGAPTITTTPATKSGHAAKKKSARKGGASASMTPKRVQDLIDDIHRRAAAAEVTRNPRMTQVYAVLAMLEELSLLHTNRGAQDPLTKRGIRRGTNDPRTSLIASLYALDAQMLTQIATELAAQIASRGLDQQAGHSAPYLKGTQATLRVLDADLAPHFTLDAQFLEEHTKSGIESLLTEAGFVTHYNSKKNDPAAFKRLLAGRHEDIVKAVMKAGFDFTGFVPRALHVPMK